MNEHPPENKSVPVFHRPFREVARAVLVTIPDLFPHKSIIREEIGKAVFLPDQNKQWTMLATSLRHLGVADTQWKRQVQYIMRDPTEYRHVLKKLSDEVEHIPTECSYCGESASPCKCEPERYEDR